jgi:hypothetical protein
MPDVTESLVHLTTLLSVDDETSLGIWEQSESKHPDQTVEQKPENITPQGL